jgi:NADPH:quinone reductase-like Zn-dependent oxidoreductase
MKAIVRNRYGPPEETLNFKDNVEKPSPADNEVLVRVRATSINKADLYDLDPSFLIRLIMGGFGKPKSQFVLSDMAGLVESVGKNVTRFKPGEEVFGNANWGLAEYATAREDRIALKPPNVTFEEAAGVGIAGITALQALRDKGKVRSGQKVLIDGSSGGVGTFAVQIAKWYGTEVTAVCSTKNIEVARSLGADNIIDYKKEDFTKESQKYDLILPVNGYHSIFSYRRALTPQGRWLLVGSSKVIRLLLETIVFGRLLSRKDGKNMRFLGVAKLNQPDLIFLGQLLQDGKVKTLIDRTYKLSEFVEALKYFEEGHVRGKVIIQIE